MELLAGIETRQTIRAFKPTPIPRDVIEKVLTAAAKSPSYQNSQPWQVAVVTGKKRDELSRVLCENAKAGVTTNADMPAGPLSWPPEVQDRIQEGTASRMAILGIDRNDPEGRAKIMLQNFEFYGAPCVLILMMDSRLSEWSIFDMGLFAQTLSLAAHSFGLGTCLQATVIRYSDQIRETLGIPKTKRLVLGISMGYADKEAPINSIRSGRAGLDDFVHWHA